MDNGGALTTSACSRILDRMIKNCTGTCCTLMLAFLVGSAACGTKKEYIYVYPDDGPEVPVYTFPDVAGDLLFVPDTAEDVMTSATDGPLPEIASYLDTLKHDFFIEDSTPLKDVHEIHIPDNSFSLPETTDDCEPLGFPNKWKGTFDGNINSNIPDFAGYTFKGPVNGAITFEFACIDGA